MASIYLYPENRERLTLLAGELGLKPNTIINRLIENAIIGEVTRREPVVTLAKNNRYDAQTLTEQSVTAVAA